MPFPLSVAVVKLPPMSDNLGVVNPCVQQSSLCIAKFLVEMGENICRKERTISE